MQSDMFDVMDLEETSVLNFLPPEFKYSNIKVTEFSCCEGEPKFKVSGRCDISTSDEAEIWLKSFYSLTNSSFNKKVGRPDYHSSETNSHKRIIFKAFRKCILNTANKDQNCPAFLSLKITAVTDFNKHESKPYYQEKAKLRQLQREFPMEFEIDFCHDHFIQRADYARRKLVDESTKKSFIELFEEDLTPSSSWRRYRHELKANNPIDWPILFADKSICPDYKWAFNFYCKWIHNKFGSGSTEMDRAKALVENFNNECKRETGSFDEEFATIKESSNGQWAIAICDLFMRRVHKLIPQAADLMLVDATSNLDREDSKLFHFVTPSAIGGLPLANLITTREDEDTISFGLALLKTILPEYAFYGRGKDVGPCLIITDDSTPERNSLTRAW